MADIKELVKLAVDLHRGSIEKYSREQSSEALRQALIEANGGSSKMDARRIRDGKCGELFSIIEQILEATIIDELSADDFFNNMVEYKNVALGDKAVFEVEDADLFLVAKAASGTQAIRRQRLSGYNEVPVDTSVHVVRIYEELDRILAGRVDFNHMIDLVARSFKQCILEDIFTLWGTVATANNSTYVVSGSYSEDDLLELIEHVEAAAGGKTATIVGTKAAIRKAKESIQSDGAKEELHSMGYYGTFYGTPVIALPQRHKAGTTTFVFPDNVLTIVAGADKPIKFVYEGDPYMIRRDASENMDLTEEFFYSEKYGIAIAVANGIGGFGRYTITP